MLHGANEILQENGELENSVNRCKQKSILFYGAVKKPEIYR
jgi:hypothetical protein